MIAIFITASKRTGKTLAKRLARLFGLSYGVGQGSRPNKKRIVIIIAYEKAARTLVRAAAFVVLPFKPKELYSLKESILSGVRRMGSSLPGCFLRYCSIKSITATPMSM